MRLMSRTAAAAAAGMMMGIALVSVDELAAAALALGIVPLDGLAQPAGRLIALASDDQRDVTKPGHFPVDGGDVPSRGVGGGRQILRVRRRLIQPVLLGRDERLET